MCAYREYLAMMTEEQIDRYEAFRRSSLQKASMRKVISSLQLPMIPCQPSRSGSAQHKPAARFHRSCLRYRVSMSPICSAGCGSVSVYL